MATALFDQTPSRITRRLAEVTPADVVLVFRYSSEEADLRMDVADAAEAHAALEEPGTIDWADIKKTFGL